MLRLGKILYYLVSIIIFLGWIFAIVTWIKNGAKIPKLLNVLAILVSIISIMACIIFFKEIKHISLFVLIIPTFLVYLIWIWLYMPDNK
jgi:hypothetical protein